MSSTSEQRAPHRELFDLHRAIARRRSHNSHGGGIAVRGGATAEELAAVLVTLQRRPIAVATGGYERWRVGRIDAVAPHAHR